MSARLLTLLNALVLLLAIGSFAAGPAQAAPQARTTLAAPIGSGFQYQGQLGSALGPISGQCDFQFSMWDSISSGVKLGATQTLTAVPVSQGRFTVTLNEANQFGPNALTGDARWLEITVECLDTPPTPLTPRQPVTPAAYAQYAAKAGNVPWTGVGNVPSGLTALGGLSCPANQVIKSNGSTWTCAADADTTYSAGAGLTLTNTQFSVNYGGNGSANTAARSDHNHATQKWYASTWVSTLELHNDAGPALTAYADGNGGNTAVYGQSPSGAGVYGNSSNWTGVYGVSGSSSGMGVYGGNSSGGYGVYGYAWGTYPSTGVYGENPHDGGIGVRGTGGPSGYGVWGTCNINSNCWGVFGESSQGYAGYFAGKVRVTGSLSKGSGSFQIDHPLDPENKYLYHSFVESPDMMNIYNGNVKLDNKGEATVTMPDWFQALNMEFRYQLTALDAPGPNLYIAKQIKDNQFKIAGGAPNGSVSWQVTGIRHDPYAEKNRIPVEEDKAPEDRGKYLYPKEYGKAESQGIDYERTKQARGQQRPQPPKEEPRPQR